MDEEPVARALLVAGVTCLTVGLVTLALGIVFVVVDLHESELLVTWAIAIASGVGSIIAGAQISSFTCHGRSSRSTSVWYLLVFIGSVLIGAGFQVALLVLSSFHVMKDGGRKEIFIFFLASSTIQMAALVVAPLLLTCNPKIRVPLFGSKNIKTGKQSSDNYGFIGDGEMWCSSRSTKGTNLSRWPAMEHLESVTARSSTSSVGSIHPGHYIAGDHHHKFIGPSSDEANSTTSTPSTFLETPVVKQNTTENGGVVYAEIHTSKSKPNSIQTPTIAPPSKVPVRPPRLRDSFNHSQNEISKTTSSLPRKPEKIAISTVSRSYSPLGNVNRKRIFLYDPVEMDICTPKTKRVNFHKESNGGLINAYDDSWVPRKGIFGHNLHGINVNGLHSLRPSTCTSLPSRIGSTNIPSHPKKASRPKDPPPDVPNGVERGSSFPLSNGDVYHRFIVGDWEDLNSPIDGIRLQATSTPKHSRKVTFLESDT